jgi:Zn finger protein HypA/HybF involved in hydrogenase expression
MLLACNHRAIQCDDCDDWIHIRCGNITPTEYNRLQSISHFTWTCPPCGSINLSTAYSLEVVFMVDSNTLSFSSLLSSSVKLLYGLLISISFIDAVLRFIDPQGGHVHVKWLIDCNLLYSVGPCIWTILLLSGDIEINPGPSKCPCGICKPTVASNHRAIQCVDWWLDSHQMWEYYTYW